MMDFSYTDLGINFILLELGLDARLRREMGEGMVTRGWVCRALLST